MRTVRFTKYTSTIALVFFSIYFLYGLFRLPFLQYLVSLSIGGIVYGLTDSYELSTISLLCSHFIFSVVKKEGFTNQVPSEGPVRQIVERVQNIKRNLQGVGSPMSEGFEDADAKDHTLEDKAGDEKEETVTTARSKPAKVKEVKKSEEEPFKNENGLFKLGEIPSDAAGGFHIDAGTTVVNALKSLNPDQITAMTKDTQQLIETQKSLMTMLKTFTPMVNEGKQMMDTFNTMFTPAMGSMKTSSDMLGGVKS
jgi:hypothetical protein